MSSYFRSIQRLFGILAKCGVVGGLKLFFALRANAPSTTVNIPGSGKTLTLRPKTTDVSVFDQVFIHGLYSDFGPSDPHVIIDAGGHIGCSAISFALRFPHAKVVVLEPEASNFTLLTQNTAPFPNIVCIQSALWSRDGEVSILPDSTGSTWGHRAEEPQSTVVAGAVVNRSIRCTSMPSILREFNISTVDILKVDIEGAEAQVFGPGCEEWLGRVRSLVVEVHDRMYPGCSAVVEGALKDFSGEVRLLLE